MVEPSPYPLAQVSSSKEKYGVELLGRCLQLGKFALSYAFVGERTGTQVLFSRESPLPPPLLTPAPPRPSPLEISPKSSISSVLFHHVMIHLMQVMEMVLKTHCLHEVDP